MEGNPNTVFIVVDIRIEFEHCNKPIGNRPTIDIVYVTRDIQKAKEIRDIFKIRNEVNKDDYYTYIKQIDIDYLSKRYNLELMYLEKDKKLKEYENKISNLEKELKVFKNEVDVKKD